MTEIDAPAPEPSEEQRKAAMALVAKLWANAEAATYRPESTRAMLTASVDTVLAALADVAEATRRECAEVAQEVIGENVRKTAVLDAENTILRGMAARLMPCHYCKVDDIAKCPSGFPGCALADDLIVADDLAFRHMKDRAMKAEADLAEMERLKNEAATLAHERWAEIEALKAVVTAARDVSREYRNGCRTSAAMRRLADALAALDEKEAGDDAR